MSSLIRRIVSGGDGRRTRFDTEKNELAPPADLVRAFPKALYRKISAKLSGRRSVAPWWPVSVIPEIERHMNPTSRVIEFGSGSSTLWLASRVGHVVSVENDEAWHRRTRERLDAAGHSNVTLLLRDDETYWQVPPDLGPFDLAIVDGAFRWRCIEAVIPRMASGGLVYLDNADSDKDFRSYPQPSMKYEAQRIMEASVAKTPGARLEKRLGLIDGEIFAGEGWLLYLP